VCQVLYAKQAALHVHQGMDSDVRALLRTSTEFVAGGVQLVSALWSQSVTGVISALGTLRDTYESYTSKEPRTW
jgi:hypothetical protein